MLRLAVVPMLIVTIASAPTLSAQRADSLRVGADIRVDRWQPSREFYRGTYVSRDTLTFVLASHDDPRELIAIPVRDIGRVELRIGERTAGQAFRHGARRGALVGLGASAVLMGFGLISDQRGGDAEYVSGTAVAAVVSVLITGTTTLIGGAIGAAHRDRWAVVPLRP